MTGSRRCLCAAISLVLPAASFARGGEPPSVSDLRAAFEAQFPKSDANGTALELERLSAALGIDLVPKPFPDPEKPGEAPPPPDDGRARPAPGTENKLPLLDFLQRELAVANERIGRAPPPIERYLEEHDGELAEIESVLLGGEEPRWEMDVASRRSAPIPNLLGLIRLQRLLMARALVLARSARVDDAIQTMEASWRLHGALLSRPELISQLIAIAVARMQAGVLRKIDSPAYDWPDRLRSGGVLQGVLAALQNEVWFYSDLPEEQLDRHIRIWRGFAASVQAHRGCAWTSESLGSAWRAALEPIESEEDRILAEIAMPNIFNSLLRARRVAIDNELTALVLDARAERAALHRRHWPGKLLSLGTGICPEARWTYRVDRNGTSRFALEDRIEDDSAPFRLPLEFTAGKPLVRRPTRKGVVVNRAARA